MMEQVLTAGLGTVIGAGIGGAITAKVVSAVTKTQLVEIAKRVDRHEDIAKDTAEAKSVAAAAGAEIDSLGKRVDNHDEMFGRVVFRDVCNSCKEGKDERHEEYLRWHNEYLQRLTALEAALRTCIADLIGEIRGKSH